MLPCFNMKVVVKGFLLKAIVKSASAKQLLWVALVRPMYVSLFEFESGCEGCLAIIHSVVCVFLKRGMLV